MIIHVVIRKHNDDNGLNILRPRQDGRYFPDDIFKCILLNENICISIRISLKFVPKGPINNIQALVQIMAWHRTDDKLLSEPMVVSLLTHICVTRPQWVKQCCSIIYPSITTITMSIVINDNKMLCCLVIAIKYGKIIKDFVVKYQWRKFI